MEEKKYQKLAIKSIFSILLIFSLPVIFFLILKNLLPIEIKTNKIFTISGMIISYFVSWIIFYRYYIKNIKNN